MPRAGFAEGDVAATRDPNFIRIYIHTHIIYYTILYYKYNIYIYIYIYIYI